MARRLSGFKPTGHLQLGNLLGAIRPTVASQHHLDPDAGGATRRHPGELRQHQGATVVRSGGPTAGSAPVEPAGRGPCHDLIALVVDLHAMTVKHDPCRLRGLTLEVATLLLAAGVDPERSLFYVQSHVPEHTELHYLLECATTYGEAHRMIQFKEKAARGTAGAARLSLLTYPTLMAADILLHDADEVPVGADQTQHVELARDIAVRFNGRYGPTFAVPKAVNPGFTGRIRELSDPSAKMGKTNDHDAGVLFLLDPPEVIRRKVMRAVTDPGREVRYDPVGQPGVANLLEILAGCVDGSPATLAGRFSTYRELKEAVADSVVATLRPIQERYADLTKDPATVEQILREGAARARVLAQPRVRAVRDRLGLL